MALKTHPIGAEGVYKDNLPRVAGVEVEIRKAKKDTMMEWVAGVQIELKKKKTDFFVFENIRGPTRFEVRTATVPRQRLQKACWVF